MKFDKVSFEETLGTDVVASEKCVGCGACEPVCPVEVADGFNQGLSSHKAIYLPIPHTIPNPYVIDLAACNHCGACEKVCPTQAIQLSLEKRKAFRILVVDDELIVRDSLKEWLEDEHFDVESFYRQRTVPRSSDTKF